MRKAIVLVILLNITFSYLEEMDLKTVAEHLKTSKIDYLPLNKCVEEECKQNKIMKDEMECMQECLKKLAGKNSESRAQFMNNLKDLPKNFCLMDEKIDKSKLTKKEYLLKFAQGPCNPLMVVPGIMATKLVVNIDCQVLKDSEPTTFEFCGWNACSKSKTEFWKSVPQNEYVLWIPSLTSPLSIFSISVNSNLCFAHLIKPHFDLEKEPDEMIIPRKGVTIKIFGFTPGTEKDRNCGGSSIKDLLPLPLQNQTTAGFSNLINAFDYIGYISGLTMQPVPYNFYYSYRKNEFKKGFLDNLKKLNLYTQKKVTLIAHSMGNINVLHNLNLMSKEEKANLIFNLVSIAPPFLGAMKTIKILVSGNDEYTTFSGTFGFHFKASVKTCSNQLSIVDLAIKNPFRIFKNEPFMDLIYKRIEYERNHDIPFSQSGILFWPPKDAICHDDLNNKFCNIGFNNFDGVKTVKFPNGDEYTYDELVEMMDKYGLTKNSGKLFRKLYSDEIGKINPGVPVFLIYSNSIPTLFGFTLPEGYEEMIKNEKFPSTKEEIHVNGDKTVPTFSSLIPPLKWAFDFDQEKDDPFKQGDKFPVKFIEYCSKYNEAHNLYDILTDKGFAINKNDYIGLRCSCMGKVKYEDCEHAAMINDFNVVKTMFTIAVGTQYVSQEQFTVIEQLEEEQLEKDVNICNHIYSNVFEDKLNTNEL